MGGEILSVADALAKAAPYLVAVVGLTLSFLWFLFKMATLIRDAARDMAHEHRAQVARLGDEYLARAENQAREVTTVLKQAAAAIETNTRIQGHVLQRFNGQAMGPDFSGGKQS